MNIFIDNPDFYPTPNAVIEQMMMGVDFFGKTILEPSAGKGNIVDWLKGNGAREVIACENDPNNLRLLSGKCDILAEDFLTVTSEQVSHIDLIVMNPPFSNGAEHILHAFEIAPPGCTVVSLCNESNLSRYTYSKKEKLLSETIEMYGQWESLGNCFSRAERKTEVRVALVKLYKDGEGASEFENYFFDQFDSDAMGGEQEGLMQYNFVRDIVNRYVSAVKMFDDVLAMSNKINETADFYDFKTEVDEKTGETKQVKQTYGYLPIRFGAVTTGDRSTAVSHQQYKRELQKHYWHIIFQKLNMEKYATKELREQINKFIESQKCVPFTMKNIYKVIEMVIQTNGQRMLKTLVEAFDLICSFSAENSTAGETWKTNANYMVNKRFIVPSICSGYDWYDHKPKPYVELSDYGRNKMDDVCKALCNMTGQNYDEVGSLFDAVNYSRYSPHLNPGKEWGEWFEWGFFRCRGYKKGTMHFEFLDEEVWFKFNYTVAQSKGWNLPKKTQKERKRPERKKKEAAPMAEPDGQLVMFGDRKSVV